jgi:uncharacterized membrane protein affecting hemolysin expression
MTLSRQNGTETSEVLLDTSRSSTRVETVGNVIPGNSNALAGALVLDHEQELLGHAHTYDDVRVN